MPEKIKTLYDNLVKEGYDLPDYNTFIVDMGDNGKRQRFHSSLLEEGYDLPDFNTFTTDMGVDKKKKSIGFSTELPMEPAPKPFEKQGVGLGVKAPTAYTKEAPSERVGKMLNVQTMPSEKPAFVDNLRQRAEVDEKILNDPTFTLMSSEAGDVNESKRVKIFEEKNKAEAAKRGYNNVKELYSDMDEYLADFLDERQKQEYIGKRDRVELLKQINKAKAEGQPTEELQKKYDEQVTQFSKAKAELITNADQEIKDLRKELEVADPDEKDDILSQIDALEASKKDFFKPKVEAKDIVEVEGLTEGSTDQEKVQIYAHALMRERSDLRQALGITKDEDAMIAYYSTAGGDDPYWRRLQDVEDKLEAVAPVVLVNETPVVGTESAWDVFGKVFKENLVPQATDKGTQQELSSNLIRGLDVAGVNVKNIQEDSYKTLEKTSKPYEDWSSKDIALMAAPTIAIMPKFIAATILTEGLGSFAAVSPYWRSIKILSERGSIGSVATEGSLLRVLQTNKYGRGLLKASFKGLEYGTQSQVETMLFGADKGEMGFVNGLVGGSLGVGVEKVTRVAGKGVAKVITAVFGSKAPEATGKILAAAKKFYNYTKEQNTKALGEVGEELGEDLGGMWMESENGKEFFDKVNEHYGTPSKALKFFLSTYMMGYGLGAASQIGSVAFSSAGKLYKGLSSKDRAIADSVISDIRQEQNHADVDAGVELIQDSDLSDEEKAKAEDRITTQGEAVNGVIEGRLTAEELDEVVSSFEEMKQPEVEEEVKPEVGDKTQARISELEAQRDSEIENLKMIFTDNPSEEEKAERIKERKQEIADEYNSQIEDIKKKSAERAANKTKQDESREEKIDGEVEDSRTEKDFANEKESYRVIVGDEAFNDIVESGVVRTNAKNKGGQSLAEKLANRPTLYPSFSRGSASMDYANSNPNHYIIVTDDASIQPSKSGRHGKGTTMFPTDENGNHLESLDGKKVKVYRHIGNGKYELVYANGKLINQQTTKQDESKTETNGEVVLEGVREEGNQDKGREESEQLREEEVKVEPTEGSTTTLPPASKYGQPREMVYKDGKWQQKVGRELTEVSSSAQKEAAEAFASTPQSKSQAVTGGVSMSSKSSVDDIKARVTDAAKVAVINMAQKAVRTLKSVLPNFDIVVHETTDTYNKSMAEVNGRAGSGGNFAFVKNADGTYSGRIDINLSNANARTVPHEVAHGVMLAAFGDKPALFKAFKAKIASALKGETNAKLEQFITNYNDIEKPEEYLAELTGYLANNQDSIAPSTLQKIAAIINDIVSRLTNGAIKPFQNLRDTKEVIEFFDNISKAISEGESIDGITGKINKNAKSTNVKVNISSIKSKSSLIQDLGLERFEGMSKRIKTGYSLKDIGDVISHLTFSDRLVTGKVGSKSYLGGILFAAATGRVWASFTKSRVSSIISGMPKNKDGYRYLMPALLTNESHMSNKDMVSTSLYLVEKAVADKSISPAEADARVRKALKKKDLIAFGEIYNNVIGKSKLTPEVVKNGIHKAIVESKSSFEERRAFLESLLGNADINFSLRFGTLPSFKVLAKGLAEPITEGHDYGDILLAIRTKGELVAVQPQEGDEDYHPSYPWVIRSLNPNGTIADVETLIFDKSYNAVDVFPEVTNKKGQKFSYSDYKQKYGEGAKSAYLGYMGARSTMSTSVSESVETKAATKEVVSGLPEKFKSKSQQNPALKDVKSTANALDTKFNPEYKNTIVEKMSFFDERISNQDFPNVLEFAQHILPKSLFSRHKSLYELGARNNITVSNDWLPPGVAGAWAFGNVQMNKNTSKTLIADYEEFAETLNHEIIHGLISSGIKDNYALSKDLEGVMNRVVDNFDSASNEVKHIISYIQDERIRFKEKDIWGSTSQEIDSGNYREVGSLEELITYAFTNKEFADFLDSIPASKKINTKGKSIFQQLKNIIRDFIAKKIKGATALDEINSVLDKYFDTAWNESSLSERNKLYEWGLKFNADENIFDAYDNDPNKVSKAYHKSKAEGSNLKLVEAVEEFLGETGGVSIEKFKPSEEAKKAAELTIKMESAMAKAPSIKEKQASKIATDIEKLKAENPGKADIIDTVVNNIDAIRAQLLEAGIIESINCKWG
jgi:hypothetical protein